MQEHTETGKESTEIIIFYTYTPIKDPEAVVRWQKELGLLLGLTGRILVAHEGINGTAEGTISAIKEYERRMHEQDGREGAYADFSHVWFKHSPGTGNAFPKLKVKVRKEIVTLGLGDDDVDPNEITGTHLEPEELKKWIEQGEEFEIIDMRNDYEYQVGYFRGSINPNLENFRDLSKTLPNIEPMKQKKVLTVCTYGVRCEKASGYLKSKGFTDVYQLNGGIGSYMKKFPGEDFLGSLYVFDGRITERFTDDYEVVGKCSVCAEKSERYDNCARSECHKKMIVCDACSENNAHVYCSDACSTLMLAHPHRVQR